MDSTQHFLRQRLGVDLPVLQAPMAGVQDHTLAAAVSNAGGLGALPAAMLSPTALADELRALVRATPRPYNLNFFCHQPPEPDAQREQRWRERLAPLYAETGLSQPDTSGGATRQPFSHAMADVIEPYRPPVLSFHFGLPAPDLLARVKGWGALVLSTATTVAEARWLQAHGADAVIAQGLEAGGHRGMFLDEDLSTQLGSLALWPQVAAAVELPVIAAGGIADAAGVACAHALGAQAVQVGTAYLLCDEARTPPLHRQALQGDASTALTNVFSGRPARGIVNRLLRELGPISPLAPAFPLASAALAPLRSWGEARGDDGFMALWSGQNRSGCRAQPAAVITRRLAAGWPA